MSLERRGGLIAAFLLLLTTLILLAPALRPGTILLAANLPYRLDPLWQPLAPAGAIATTNPSLSDQFYQFHPWTLISWQMVMRGELPTWNPAINGGQPLFGNGLAGILSPFNLVGKLFPFSASYLVGALLRLWVAGGFTYAYSRTIGLSQAASWLAMLVFSLSGPLTSWLWGTPSHVLAWLPALLWTGEKLLSTHQLAWALAAAGALALLILSAQPEMAFQIGIVWGIYLLCRAGWLEGSLWLGVRRHLAWWLLVAVLGTALAAVEILGFVEALGHSAILAHRQLSATDGVADWLRRIFLSWHEWPALVTILLPHFLGREVDESYWYPSGNSIENNAYAGVLPLLLALLALWAAWRAKNQAADRWIWLWAGIGFSALALAVGLPLLAGLRYLPPFSLTLLSRLRGVYVFAIAILAGWGLDFLIANHALRRPLLLLIAAAAALNLLLVVAATIGFTLFAEQLLASGRAFMQANLGSPALDYPLADLYALVERRQQAKIAMLHPSNAIMYLPLLVGVGVALLLYLLHKRRVARAWLVPTLVALTAFDLLWVNAGSISTVPAAWLEANPPAVEYLQRQPGNFRVVGTHQILNPNMSMLTHLEDVRGYDALAVNRYVELLAGLDGYAPAGYHNYFRHLDDPRLDLFNATYGLSRTAPSDPRWEPVFEDPSGVTVYRSHTALPRAYIVYDAEIVESPEQSLVRTLDANFDARRSVVLEQMPEGWTPAAEPPVEAPQVTFNERRATSQQLVVTTSVPALLVLVESYSPGWRATIDHQPTPIYVANHAFRAVVVPAGRHIVAFHYAPPLLSLGVAISEGAMLVVLGLLIRMRYAKHKRVPMP